MTASDSRGLGRCTGIGQHVLPCTALGRAWKGVVVKYSIKTHEMYMGLSG